MNSLVLFLFIFLLLSDNRFWILPLEIVQKAHSLTSCLLAVLDARERNPMNPRKRRSKTISSGTQNIDHRPAR